jgi:dTDP-4-dehydrorhamnose reductase
MRVLVLGSAGQVGRELARAAWPAGFRVTGAARAEIDIRDAATVDAAIAGLGADLVVNAAAYTAVDRAETEREAAFAVNHAAAGALAMACAPRGAVLIHLSTDYVFDGAGAPRPYREDDPVGPVNVYGASKEAGETAIRAALPERHLILRTSWVFGAHGQNFVKTMLRLAGEREELAVVDDQTGCPTPAADIAGVIVRLAAAVADGVRYWGTYHFAGAGAVTWHGFADAIFDEAAAVRPEMRRPRIRRICAADLPLPARRPAWSVLDCGRIGRDFGIVPPSWRPGLAAMLREHLGADAA